MHESIRELNKCNFAYAHSPNFDIFFEKCNFPYMQSLTNVGRWGKWSHVVGVDSHFPTTTIWTV